MNEVEQESLAAALTAATSSANVITIEGSVTFSVGGAHGTQFANTVDVTIRGVDGTTPTIKVDGAGVTALGSATNKVTFENLTIKDNSESYAEGNWEFGCLEFAGNSEFKNVTFINPVGFPKVDDVANGTLFTECIFNGTEEFYGIYLYHGDFELKDCTINGARGLKIFEAYGGAITSVDIDGCVFEDISKKPGIAIDINYGGDTLYEPCLTNTTDITIRDSFFINCQEGETGGDAAYIYENDRDWTTSEPGGSFTVENNTVVNAGFTAPTISPADGAQTGAFSLELTAIAGTIYYTTDGTEPSSSNGTAYTAPVEITEGCTVKAIAVCKTISSQVNTKTFTITEPTTPGSEEVEVDVNGTTTTVTKTETTVETAAGTETTTTFESDNVKTEAIVVEKTDGTVEKTVSTTIDSTSDVNASINMAVVQINKANENTTAGTDVKVEIVIDTGSTAEQIAISKDAIAAVAGNDGAALTVSNKDVAVTLDNATLKGIASGDVKVDVKRAAVSALTPAQQDVVKDNIVVSIEVIADGKYVDGLDGKAQIKIPLDSETADHKVYFVDTDGSLVEMKEIERTSEYIIVETDHFSEYVLMSASSVPTVPSIPPIFIPMPDDDDFIPPMQAVKEDDKSTEIACIAAGAVAAMLAAILVATSRGRL